MHVLPAELINPIGLCIFIIVKKKTLQKELSKQALQENIKVIEYKCVSINRGNQKCNAENRSLIWLKNVLIILCA